MNITVNRCNSIENGQITIVENTLNIKYAINGTGKSTIARAIETHINDRKNSNNDFQMLKPFKYRGEKETNNPEIKGLDAINSIAVFNEDYINQYVFLPDELLKDSFSIFIRDDQYEKGMKEINDLIRTGGQELCPKTNNISFILKSIYNRSTNNLEQHKLISTLT